MTISISFDIEPDLYTGSYKGVIEGIAVILRLLNKYNIKATFFITCDCLEKYPEIFKILKRNGHEVALHAYRHTRFDELSLKEKEKHLRKAITCFKKYLGFSPLGFRAPQLSIDNETLDLLEKYGFKYDSSYAPLNFMQLFFFPSKFNSWMRSFFSKADKYKIRKNLAEIPTTSLVLPFVSLIFRVFPCSFNKLFFNLLRATHGDTIFYAHSWDFIDLPQSRIARVWPKERLIKNLDCFLSIYSKKHKFSRIIDIAREK